MNRKLSLFSLVSLFLFSFVVSSVFHSHVFLYNKENDLVDSPIQNQLTADSTISDPSATSSLFDYNVSVTVDSGNLTQIENITVDIYKDEYWNDSFLTLEPQRLGDDDYYGFHYTNLTDIFDPFPDQTLTQDQLNNWTYGDDINVTWYETFVVVSNITETINITNGLILLQITFVLKNGSIWYVNNIRYSFANGTKIANFGSNIFFLTTIYLYNYSTNNYSQLGIGGNNFSYSKDITLLKLNSTACSVYFQMQRGLKGIQFWYETNETELNQIYNATYSFQHVPEGSQPFNSDLWTSAEGTNTNIQILDTFEGHSKVVELYDNNAFGEAILTHSIVNPQVTSTIEFWVYFNEGSDQSTHYNMFQMYDGVTRATQLEFRYIGDYLRCPQYGGGGQLIIDGGGFPNHTWYHIRVDFDCSVDTFSCWVNGSYSGYFNFENNVTQIDQIKFRTNGSYTNGYLYVDAVDYSWIEGYYTNRNYNNITQATFTYSTDQIINRFKVDWNGNRYNLTNNEWLDDHTFTELNTTNQNGGIYQALSNETNLDFSILTNSYPDEVRLHTNNSQYITFDGVDEYINASHVVDYNFSISEEFSISCWVRYENDANYPVIMAKSNPDSPYTGVWLYAYSNAIFLDLYDESGTQMYRSSSVNPEGQGWTHIVATYDGSNDWSGIHIYINGTLSDGAGTGSGLGQVANTFPCVIGSSGGSAWFFEGDIDELATWRGIALDNSDIEILCNGIDGNDRNCDLTQHPKYEYLQNWWKLGGGIDQYPNIYDYKNNSHGIMENMEPSDIITQGFSFLEEIELTYNFSTSEQHYLNFIFNNDLGNDYYATETLRSQYDLTLKQLGVQADYPNYPSLFETPNDELNLDAKILSFDYDATLNLTAIVDDGSQKTKEEITIQPDLGVDGWLIDDFNDGTLNTSFWSIVAGSPTEANGYLLCDNSLDGISSPVINFYGIGNKFGCYMKCDKITDEVIIFGGALSFHFAGFVGYDDGIYCVLINDTGGGAIDYQMNQSIYVDPYSWHFYSTEQLNESAWSFYVDGELVATLNFPKNFTTGLGITLQTLYVFGVGTPAIAKFDSVWLLNSHDLTVLDYQNEDITALFSNTVDRIIRIEFHHSIQYQWFDFNPSFQYQTWYRFKWVRTDGGIFSQYAPHRFYSDVINTTACINPENLGQTTDNWTFAIRPFCLLNGSWNSRVRIFNSTSYYEYNQPFTINKLDVFLESVDDTEGVIVYNEELNSTRGIFEFIADGTVGTYIITLNTSIYQQTVTKVYVNFQSIPFTDNGDYTFNITFVILEEGSFDLDVYFEEDLNPQMVMWYFSDSSQIFITDGDRIAVGTGTYETVYVLLSENPNTTSDLRFYMWRGIYNSPDHIIENRTDYSFTMSFVSTFDTSNTYYCWVNDSYIPPNYYNITFIMDFIGEGVGSGADMETPDWLRVFLRDFPTWFIPLIIIIIGVVGTLYVRKLWREK